MATTEISDDGRKFIARFLMAKSIETSDDETPNDPLALQWRDMETNLSPLIAAHVDDRKPNFEKIAKAWKAANAQAAAGKFADAIKVGTALSALVKPATQTDAPDAKVENTSETAEETNDVTPFQKAKSVWEKTRKDLNGQMKTLQSSILKRCAEMGITDIKGETDELFRQLGGIDRELESALQAVIDAKDPDKRQAGQKAAAKVTDQMIKELNSPFFAALDSGNGFQNIAVRADAVTALRAVRSLL